jgi:hypothetical protein
MIFLGAEDLSHLYRNIWGDGWEAGEPGRGIFSYGRKEGEPWRGIFSYGRKEGEPWRGIFSYGRKEIGFLKETRFLTLQ